MLETLWSTILHRYRLQVVLQTCILFFFAPILQVRLSVYERIFSLYQKYFPLLSRGLFMFCFYDESLFLVLFLYYNVGTTRYSEVLSPFRQEFNSTIPDVVNVIHEFNLHDVSPFLSVPSRNQVLLRLWPFFSN